MDRRGVLKVAGAVTAAASSHRGTSTCCFCCLFREGVQAEGGRRCVEERIWSVRRPRAIG